MTRFARAQGSKSSNERVPHEATLWADMKQQMVTKSVDADDSDRQKFVQLRENNYKDFLAEKATKQKSVWTDFDVTTSDNVPPSTPKEQFYGNDKKSVTLSVERKKKRQESELQLDLVNLENGVNINNAVKKEKKMQELKQENGLKTRESKAKGVEVENSGPGDNIAVKKQKELKTTQFEQGKQSDKAKVNPPVLPKIEKVFANELEKLKYGKKLARRERQRERLKQRKSILAAGEDNRLTQIYKEKEERRKQKRLEKVLTRKAEREKLKDTAETTLTNNEDGSSDVKTGVLSKTQKRKRRKENKMTLIGKGLVGDDKHNIDSFSQDQTEENTETNYKNKNQSITSETVSQESDKIATDNKNSKNKGNLSETAVEETIPENEPNINGSVRESKKIKQIEAVSESPDESNANLNRNNNFTNNKLNEQPNKPIKEHKLRNSKWTGEHRKKPLGPETTILHLKGKSIEIALFDGFPVIKTDHERLTQLRRDMVSKGLPRSEVQRAMQLERRRAEKALVREKKEMCFRCRKSGHKLTECPEMLTQETEATGICFKCGSTEHTHFECKVVQQQQFKFATCFICREPGHIAKQCPQNARGIYPQGGCCKVCGDVTHLKKDCPQYQAQQEHNAVQVDTIDSANLEGLDLVKDDVKVPNIGTPVKKAKVVKF